MVMPAKVKVPAPLTVTLAVLAMPRLAVVIVLTVPPPLTVRLPGRTTAAPVPAMVTVPALT